ncbi:MAG: hypothetical protein RLZZ252_1786 [Bacteroidota bacterium]|jgi:hypothetical protein
MGKTALKNYWNNSQYYTKEKPRCRGFFFKLYEEINYLVTTKR